MRHRPTSLRSAKRLLCDECGTPVAIHAGASLRPVFACPACAERIEADRQVRYNARRRRSEAARRSEQQRCVIGDDLATCEVCGEPLGLGETRRCTQRRLVGRPLTPAAVSLMV